MVTFLCPYCNKKLAVISPAHLKTHNKTRQDAMQEFPEMPKSAFGYVLITPAKSESEKAADGYFFDKGTDITRYNNGKHSKWLDKKGLLVGM